ncbi:S-adenosylmethionine decarboxylase [Candidatus Kaiserbacteria bacterium]|nr:S-adenosylmethionine decarboxylase [Candidatus Kaiserbacteria bacterium]
MFDLLLDRKSKRGTAFSPRNLGVLIRAAIREAEMTLRADLLDAWGSKRRGPASLFYSLEESHVRVETWPEHSHVQGEVQLCNFTRDNSRATRHLAEIIIKALNPANMQLLVIMRGPGENLTPVELVTHERGSFVVARRYPS